MKRFGPDTGKALRNVGLLSTLGISFVLCIVLGVGAGVLLDRWLGTSPWLFFLGFVLGVAAAVVTLVRMLRQFGAD